MIMVLLKASGETSIECGWFEFVIQRNVGGLLGSMADPQIIFAHMDARG